MRILCIHYCVLHSILLKLLVDYDVVHQAFICMEHFLGDEQAGNLMGAQELTAVARVRDGEPVSMRNT